MRVAKDDVIAGCATWATWWLVRRTEKLRESLTDTMSINPLMAPLVTELHALGHGKDLLRLVVTSHLMVGHATGFGKLIDEKILPGVFETEKLSAAFRRENGPLIVSCFDEVDHLVKHDDGSIDLLSLKASRWTIQLSAAVQLNRAFSEIRDNYSDLYSGVVVGVFYGRRNLLSDKYDILRGINRGANHDVVDLRDYVEVLAGRDFWSWLNDDEPATQDWVLAGIQSAIADGSFREETKELLEGFTESVVERFPALGEELTDEDFAELLREISG